MTSSRGIFMRMAVFAFILSLGFSLTAAGELPESLRAWEGGPLQTISLPQLASSAGENAAVLREYGFLGGERREYSRPGATLIATLWLMEDATGSYGLFTFLSEAGMTSTRIQDDATASSPDLFLYQRGPYVLEVRGAERIPDDAERLTASIPENSGRESLLPPLPGYLPEQGLIPQSEKYLIGPLAFSKVLDRIPGSAIRFEMGAEASLAQYRLGENTVQLLLLSYPTPQLASKMLHEFQSLPALTDNASGRTLFVERKSSLIAFVLDAPNLAATETLLNRIGYQPQITWNEYVAPPGQNAGSLMLAVFSLAGFVLLIALFSGLAFGGVRVVAKRFISKPVFDRPSNMEIIRLKLKDM